MLPPSDHARVPMFKHPAAHASRSRAHSRRASCSLYAPRAHRLPLLREGLSARSTMRFRREPAEEAGMRSSRDDAQQDIRPHEDSARVKKARCSIMRHESNREEPQNRRTGTARILGLAPICAAKLFWQKSSDCNSRGASEVIFWSPWEMLRNVQVSDLHFCFFDMSILLSDCYNLVIISKSPDWAAALTPQRRPSALCPRAPPAAPRIRPPRQQPARCPAARRRPAVVTLSPRCSRRKSAFMGTCYTALLRN